MLVRSAVRVLLAALVGAASAAACGDAPDAAPADAGLDGQTSDRCAYPAGPYGLRTNDTLPDLEFERGDQPGARLRMSELRGCADTDGLLVLRITTPTCGTCGWSAAHTAELRKPGVRLVDVLVRGRDGAPPTPADAAAWAALRAVDAGPIVLDPEVRFRDSDPALMLPLLVLVDPLRMRILTTASNPDGDRIAERIDRELLRLEGGTPPPQRSFPLYDGLFTRTEWDLVQAMALPEHYPPPPDPTDRYADDPRAAALGKKLFEDAGFSSNGVVSCRSCHDPAHAFTDGLPTAHGVSVGDRNSPSVAFAAHQRWQFWDGRVDTLWAQALGPLENPLEVNGSRLAVVRRIAEVYAAEFEAVYGALPPLDDPRFPAAGKPGDAAWEAMAPTDREAVNRAFVGVGKAIAAFERTLRVEDSPLDRYARGDTAALDGVQKLGLRAFLGAGCAQCHFGPRLTDDAFHVVRFPTGRRDGQADPGRSEGLRLYSAAEFGAASVYSDAPQGRPEALAWLGNPALEGQFKTPSLRGLAATGPYGHGGSEIDLAAVAKRYGEKGLAPEDPRAVGRTEPWVPQFDVHAQHELAEFLATFTAVVRP